MTRFPLRPCKMLVLCNRYGFTIAARSLGEFQGASEAPVFAAILAEGAPRKFAQRTAARRVVKAYRLHNTKIETTLYMQTSRPPLRSTILTVVAAGLAI